MATIIVFAVIGVIVALIIVNRIRDKRRGKHACSCDCLKCGLCYSARNNTNS